MADLTRDPSLLDAVHPFDTSSPGSRGPEYATPFTEAAAAGLRLSPVMTTLQRMQEVLGTNDEVDPAFHLGDALRKEGLIDKADAFTGITNDVQFYTRVDAIRKQHEDQQAVAAAGPAGTLVAMGEGLFLDPAMMIPFVGGASKVEGGFNVARGLAAARFGVQMGAGVEFSGAVKRATMADPPSWSDIHAQAVTDALLAGAARFTRSAAGGAAVMGAPEVADAINGQDPYSQDLAKIGGSMMMGAMIGRAHAEPMTPAERSTGAWALDKLFTPVDELKAADFEPPKDTVRSTIDPSEVAAPTTLYTPKGKFTVQVEDDALANAPRPDPFAQAHSLSSAASPFHTLDEMDVSGGLPRLINSLVGQVSPNGRMFDTLVPKAADALQKLYDNAIRTRLSDEGGSAAPGGTAELQKKQLWMTHFAPAEADHLDAYKKMGLAGINMRASDFDMAVGDALRNFDRATGNDFPIPAGADRYIEQAAKSWRDKLYDPMAKQAVELGLIDEKDLDLAHGSYMHRMPMRDKLIARSDQFFDQHVPYWQGQLRAAFAEGRAKAQARVAKLDDRLRLLTLSPEDRVAALSDIRDRAERLDTTNADSIARLADISDALRDGNRDLAARLREDGGDALKEYVRQRAELRAQRRALGQGYGAVADRLDGVERRVAEQEERAVNDITRVTSRTARTLDQMERFDPDRHAAKIEKMHSDLSGLAAELERMTSAADEATARARTEVESAQANGGAPDADLLVKHAARLERIAAGQRARTERMRSIADRLDAAEGLDPEARLDELRLALKETVAETARRVLDRGEQIAALREKAARFDPKHVDAKVEATKALKADVKARFEDRWAEASDHEARLDGSHVPDFHSEARRIAEDWFDTVTGRDVGDGSAKRTNLLPRVERGPLRDRPYQVPEHLMDGWIERNARDAGSRYAQQMAGSLAWARRFEGQTPAEIERGIRDQYSDLRTRVEQAKSDEDIRALIRETGESSIRNSLDQRSTKERALAKIAARERQDVEDFRAGVEMLLGTYKAAENAGNVARVLRNLRTFNYLVEGGGFLMAHLGFLVRPAMVHGLKELMATTPKLISDLHSVEILANEARQAAVGLQMALHHRVLTIAEIGDPFARGTAVERAMQTLSTHVSKWSGLPLYLDVMSHADALITQQKLLRFALARGGDAEGLKFLGGLDVDHELAGRIADQFEQHGEVTPTGLMLPHTENWADTAAVRAYRNAIFKQASTTIPQAGYGDLPLLSKGQLGGMMLQFQTFLLAQHQRVLMRGLQEAPQRFMSGMVMMVGIGMAIAYLKAASGGKERLDKFKEEMAEHPEKLLYEGIDRSGVFPYLFWSAGMTNAFAKGGLSGRLAGPVGGTLDRVPSAAKALTKAAKGDDLGRKDRNAIIHMIPGGALPGVRQMLQGLMGDAPWQ